MSPAGPQADLGSGHLRQQKNNAIDPVIPIVIGGMFTMSKIARFIYVYGTVLPT